MRRLLALLFGALLLFGACAQEDPAVEDPEASAETTDAPDDIQAASTVQVAETELGEVLVNEDQMTLYVFLKDKKDGKSACGEGCVENWPPLEATGDPTAGDGVDGDLDTIEREDGKSQVTIGERPLYTFAADQEPGDTKGQGVGEVWYAAGPDGEPIDDDDEAAESSPY